MIEALSPMEAIRAKCLDCAHTTHEVKLCPCVKCPLHPFRFGKNPYRKKRELTDEQRAELAARMKLAREKRRAKDD